VCTGRPRSVAAVPSWWWSTGKRLAFWGGGDLLGSMKQPFGWLWMVLCVAAIGAGLKADEPRQVAKQITVTVPVDIRYLEALPAGYDQNAEKRWPLVIFLHGSGERGDELKKVTRHGPPRLVAEGRTFPFVLVSPQCPPGQWWDLTALDRWLDEVVRNYKVDTERVYLTGLSMGGFGTWGWAQRTPERFAAIVPVCGGGEPAQAARLKDLPVWAFHGAKDPTVALAKTEEMIAGIQAAGGAPRVTVYPEAAHDSWTQAYANEELYVWMLAQKRVTTGAVKP
jgi:predicted peptidase